MKDNEVYVALRAQPKHGYQDMTEERGISLLGGSLFKGEALLGLEPPNAVTKRCTLFLFCLSAWGKVQVLSRLSHPMPQMITSPSEICKGMMVEFGIGSQC